MVVTAVAVGCAGAAALVVALSGSDGEPSSRVAQPQVVSTTSGPAPVTPAAGGLSADERAYLTALKAIDPGLVVNEERAISRAENTCLDISAGETDKIVVSRVVQRLSGGNVTINEKQARDAVELMKRWICPAWSAEWASKHPSRSS